MTEEQKAKQQANLAKAREAQKAKREAAAAKAAEAAPTEEAPLQMPAMNQNWREPVVEDEPAAEVEPADPSDPFEVFLAAQDEETRSILSDAELRVIFEVETRKAQEARREATKKVAQARAARAARVAEGLISPSDAARAERKRKLARMVTFTPEIPQDANGNLIDVGYRVNGEILFHGQQVTRPYGVYLSVREQMWRATNHEMDFEGKGRISHQRRLSAQALTAKL